MRHNLRNIGVVSFFTAGSRVLGLFRDMLMFALLGAGIWNSAFLVAFTVPNLFRRLLGEGALTSALVPVFSRVLENEGRSEGFRFFNQVFFRLCLLLLVLVGFGILGLSLAGYLDWLPERGRLGAELSSILLPYMWFICLAAILSGGLQCLGRFAAAAVTPVLLNLTMISALGLAWYLNLNEQGTVYWLCGGVLLGGLLQMILPGLDFMKQGWRPQPDRGRSKALGQLWTLFLPGLLGAAILQVNILVSRLLAFSLDEASVALLYLSSRLMELPLGIFTIAVVTVYFPLLAKLAGGDDRAAFGQSFNEGLRLILAITIPAGVGLTVLADPILRLLFEWGAFDRTDVAATRPLLIIYALGLPLYSVATFSARGLHACQDMVTPVRVALVCLVSNALLGLILMQFIGASGLALANVLSASIQAGLLWRAVDEVRAFGVLKETFKICLAALGMGSACGLAHHYMPLIALPSKIIDAAFLGGAIPMGVLLYFCLLRLLKYKDLAVLEALVMRRLRSRKPLPSQAPEAP